MNEDIMKGKWQEIKGTVKEKWSKLMDDDLGALEGRGERLLGLLQKKYGYIREKTEQDYTDSVELGEIVSNLREIMIKKRDFVPFAFIARYGRPLLAKKQESPITETEERYEYDIDRYSRYRFGRRTSHLAVQQRLGLLSQRRIRSAAHRAAGIGTDRALMSVPLRV